jgi:hypothetical protein
MKRYTSENLGQPYYTDKNGKRKKLEKSIWETILSLDSVQAQINRQVRKEKLKKIYKNV